VIPKGTTHEFWKAVHAGALKAEKDLGNVEVIWKGPLREDDREEQVKVVEDFTTSKVSAIVLAPLDDTALRASVLDAKSAGIPTVIFDSDLKGKAGEDFVSFVATDNREGGKKAALRMIETLKARAESEAHTPIKIVVLRYQEGSASTANREAGFLDEIAKHKEFEVVSSNQYAGPTTETAYKASENLIAPLKGGDGKLTVDGIYCPNESSTFGMLRALQEGGFAGKVELVGFDSSDKLIAALKSGEIDALVLQNPMRMGELAVTAAVDHLRGKKVETRIDTGAQLVTKANMEEAEIKPLWSK
jgi:ribose transport system substrate-binding protein